MIYLYWLYSYVWFSTVVAYLLPVGFFYVLLCLNKVVGNFEYMLLELFVLGVFKLCRGVLWVWSLKVCQHYVLLLENIEALLGNLNMECLFSPVFLVYM